VKKILVFAGIIVFLVVVFFLTKTLYTRHQSEKYAKTAVPYIEKAVPAISKWDPEIIKTYMAPEAMKKFSDEKIVRIVDYLSRLGALEDLETPEFSRVSYIPLADHAEKKLLYYTVPARYQKGDATFNIYLVEAGGTFKIYNFSINSDALGQ